MKSLKVVAQKNEFGKVCDGRKKPIFKFHQISKARQKEREDSKKRRKKYRPEMKLQSTRNMAMKMGNHRAHTHFVYHEIHCPPGARSFILVGSEDLL